MATIRFAGKTRKIPLKPNAKRLFYYFDQQTKNRDYLSWMLMHDLSMIRQHVMGMIHDCAIPRALLIDPTYACNLACKGCYAAGYGKDEGLTYEELDSIVTQAEKLSIHFFLFTGGEPLVRRDDLLRLAQKHKFSIFHAFTNGTLIDEAYADAVAAVGNLTFGFSVEGFREETDFRRGEGTYDKVMHAMDLLKARDVPFAFSACYHPFNYETVTSDAFLDHMVEKGCWAGWYFSYLPIGKDAALELICEPDQRAHVSRRTREIRDQGKINVVDFWNDGYIVGGCIAGGRQYLHINSRGDVEPCAFCHYSDVNIREKTLLEALKSPFLKAFRQGQPFNDNPFQACPMLDNPDKFQKLVQGHGAKSTEMCAVEDVNELAAKTAPVAARWADKAQQLYLELDDTDRELAKKKMAYYRSCKR